MSEITLCTLNAKHIHASLGLRYLLANMGELQQQCTLREFTLEPWPIDIAEQLLADNPRIIGFGIYIWNREKSHQLIALLKQLRPDITIVVGGPEVSYEWQDDALVALSDFLITGQADLVFADLCHKILKGSPPLNKVLHASPPDQSQLTLPYSLYNQNDIDHRLIYVEASRGCPFKCEFCLSALDKTAKSFEQKIFLDAITELYDRGVRHFKFVDRTFNLNPKQSCEILDFFLGRLSSDLFLHFEVIPDHLPEKLKEKLQQFPAGTLQLEVGIQTFNPSVQLLISRKQDNTKSSTNLIWLRQQSNAHIHADLIIGLPGEDLASFAVGFDQLVKLAPHEIQIGVLKRLKGSPIIRHIEPFDMRYNPNPPYNILSTNLIDFQTMQRLNRFTRYWEMIANSGRFEHALIKLLGGTPFNRFMALSEWLFTKTGQVHKIALKRLFDLLYTAMTEHLHIPNDDTRKALKADFIKTGIKGRPQFLVDEKLIPTQQTRTGDSRSKRQSRHAN